MRRFYIGTMLVRFLPAHFFLIGGGMLGVFGLILWWLLPIPFSLPPFSITAFLALAYGACCLSFPRPRQTSDAPAP